MIDWQTRPFDLDEERSFEIGALSLSALRMANEWRITTRSADSGAQTQRFVFADTPASLRLRPRHADRPVIIRPLSPFTLCSGESITLFVGTPLWLAVSVEGTDEALLELPVSRPSDTWFGPSTLEGELCYAGRTRATIGDAPPEPVPGRSSTPLRLVNRAATLLLERISIPAPALSVYADEQGRLWSEAVTLVRDEDGEMASLKIEPKAPPQAAEARLLGAPRKPVEGRVLIRAFGGLFNK